MHQSSGSSIILTTIEWLIIYSENHLNVTLLKVVTNMVFGCGLIGGRIVALKLGKIIKSIFMKKNHQRVFEIFTLLKSR